MKTMFYLKRNTVNLLKRFSGISPTSLNVRICWEHAFRSGMKDKEVWKCIDINTLIG